jgi:TetR/AcrR family transcriptional regulator
MTTTRRTRDAERSREAILNAAETLFAENGYRGTSLQDIGDAAGVSRGTPSYFFGSKEKLYRAVLDRIFVGMGDLVRRARDEATAGAEGPDGVLAREISEYIDFLAARPNFVRLLLWESLTGRTGIDSLTSRADLHRQTETVIREEILNGTFRRVDPVHLMMNVVALCWFPFAQANSMMRALGRDPYDPAFLVEHKREVIALVLDGIRSGRGDGS